MNQWVNSGVDWDDIKNNRLEAVIDIIYKAVKERDYWYRTLSNYRGTNLNIESQKYRSINQLDYIYRMFNNWFLSFTEYTALGSSNEDLFGKSVFVGDNTSDGSISEMYLGKGNIDFDSLSTILNKDVTYIKNGVGVDRFVNLDALRDFYDILHLNLKNRCFSTYKRVNFGTRIVNNPAQSTIGDDFVVLGRESISTGGGATFNDAKTNFNNTPFYQQFSQDLDQDFLVNELDFGWGVSQRVAYWDFEITGDDSILYYPTDFDTYTYTYTEDKTANGIPDTNPQIDAGEKLYTTETVQAQIGRPNNQLNPRRAMGEEKVQLTETTEQAYAFDQRAMPFIDLNKQGFLKYYTEDTN